MRKLRRRYGRAKDGGLHLWMYNRRTGLWQHERNVTPETAQEWLHIYKSDEPLEYFIVARRKPPALWTPPEGR